MQVIKTIALQAANNTGQRIREQAAWFYLRHMNINEGTSPSTAFHALLTRKERESLPAPQGEKEKAVRSQLCTRSALFEAQLYDTINAYTKLFIMNDASLPDDLRKKLNAGLEQFNAQTTQMLIDKSADCVRRNASADQMAEELLSVFNTAAQNAAEINLPEDAPIVRDTKYLDESGHVDYPKYAPDNGFVAGTKHIETLDADVLIDRYGEPGGGIQYKLPAPIEKLLDEYLEEVTQ